MLRSRLRFQEPSAMYPRSAAFTSVTSFVSPLGMPTP